MSDTSFWDVILWTLWFMLLVAWITLFFRIIIDIFRDHEMGGFAKALWVLFLIFLPFLGVLIYLIARGASMNERAMAVHREQEEQFRAYVQTTAASGAPSTASELGKLAELRDAGTISAADYEQAKAKILA